MKHVSRMKKRDIIAALLDQQIVGKRGRVANAFAKVVRTETLKKGQTLIRQGAADNDLYFIFRGAVDVLKNNRWSASRGAGSHVGEMALISRRGKRSATVVAAEESEVGKVSERQFTRVADKYPEVWRETAVELADRLRATTAQVKNRNKKPRVFIGSSSEQVKLARALAVCIQTPTCEVTVWEKDIFHPSKTALQSLVESARDYDFAIFLFHPDDKVISRKKMKPGPRDNVVFEVGLFVGALGIERTFIMCPHHMKVKIPSDLFGYTIIPYKDRRGLSWEQRVCDGADQIKKEIKKSGSK